MTIESGFSKNIELVAYHDLGNKCGFQMAMQSVGGRWYLYIATWSCPGFIIMDVTDPSKPKLVNYVPEPSGKPNTNTIKIQVADGIMITQMQQLGYLFNQYPPDTPGEEGIHIWDVKDPENPKHLAHWKSGARGTHRNFYNGGRYVHLSSTCPGFSNNIYRILDIADPTKPVEVGRWWLPEQWGAGYKTAPADTRRIMLHALYPKGDKMYVAYSTAGMIILDISDITLPKLIGQLGVHPPFGGGRMGPDPPVGEYGEPPCHTVIPFSKRPLAIVTTEGSRLATAASKDVLKGRVMPMNLFGIADISDPTNPVLISTFPYPEVPPGYPEKNFSEIPGVGVYGFGVHNVHQPEYHPDLEDRDDRIYAAYYAAGLRVYDVSDPFVPKEIAYYIPPNPTKWVWNRNHYPEGKPYPGVLGVTVEEVLVDKRGYIYIDNMQDGLYILRCTV